MTALHAPPPAAPRAPRGADVVGVDVHVHVDGRQAYASEVRGTELVPVGLPGDVAGRCVALAESLGARTCAIHLRQRPGGGYVCLDVA